MDFLNFAEYDVVKPFPFSRLKWIGYFSRITEQVLRIPHLVRFSMVLGALFFSCASTLAATCDQYPGDATIYGGIISSVRPNVLIIIDTSGSMSETVPGNASNYSSVITYPVRNECRSSNGRNAANCSSARVYRFSNRNWVDTGFDLSNVTTNCNGNNPKTFLTNTGQYTGRSLTTGGGCSNRGTDTYAVGNWINWNSTVSDDVQKIVVARDVVKNLIATTNGINLGVMIFNNSDSDKRNSNGARFFSYNIGGAAFITTVKDMDALHYGTTTNRDALLAAINSTTVRPLGYTPLAESLLEAGQYFRGGPSLFGNSVGIQKSSYTSPITASCQKNYIIFVTDGMSTSDDHDELKNVCPPTIKNCQGDYDGDNMEPTSQSSGDVNSTNMWHAMDDVAKYLYDADLLPDNPLVAKTLDKQNISTYTIGFGQVGSHAQAVSLLQKTADNQHGHGATYLAGTQSDLSTALTQILSSIMSIDTSFVAPVVPVSPEAVGKSANRLYMGIFKPVNHTYWQGNLKKYGIDAKNNLVDKNGNYATWTDADGDRQDDNDSIPLAAGVESGSFRVSSISHWSDVADGADLNKGGAGEKLQRRVPSSRMIFTHTGNTFPSTLTDVAHRFSKANAAVTSALLDVSTTAERDALIDFVYGYDVYDEDTDGNITENRSWIMGDILHSKPAVVNYKSYPTGPDHVAKERDCTINRSVIYVGGNDGMLHAINDCDGSERWAFIPPDLLKDLQEIPGSVHTYGVDASPVVYQYDANRNGSIDAGDKVLMLVGSRRGGGSNSVPATGSYHLLDVTDPATPVYLWRLLGTGNFAELAESWSEPRISRMKIGGVTKIVAFLPGGYDNLNEDGRYGATQTFDGTAAVANSDSGAGTITSTGSLLPFNPRGRGLFALEIATLTSTGAPLVPATPNRIWGVINGSSTNYKSVPATDSGMTFSLVGDVAVLDVDGDGYVDRVYAVDLGGGLWRFDVGNGTVTNWSGYKIFSANPAADPTTGNTGRKIFYKPAVTLDARTTTSARGLDAVVFFGTGDREHPLNTAVVDRFYSVRDRGQITTKGEGDLTDVTDDALQYASGTKADVDSILSSLKAANNYGWYIRLNRNQGEKVLSSPVVFNKVAFFTTFTPGVSNNSNPCKPTNLGTGRLYAVNFATGEAVFNFNRANDASIASVSNTRAKKDTSVLMLEDRFKEIGKGPPAQPVIKGDKVLSSAGGDVDSNELPPGKRFIPLYWGQR